MEAALELSGGSETRFNYTMLRLPTGHYSSLAVEFDPYDKSARLCLRGWQLFVVPSMDAVKSK